MPDLNSIHIPEPKHWQDFENIVLASLEIKWGSTNLSKNGRPGQKQDGVDIWGDDDFGRLVGIQCKNTSKSINVGIIEDEIIKAEGFEPDLRVLYIATTALPDSSLQKHVRLISKDRVDKNKFAVGIFYWEDLIRELIKNPSQFNIFYPGLNLIKPDTGISSGRLLSILALTYFGYYIDDYIFLIFGELGEISGEDPDQIKTLLLEIGAAAVTVFDQESQKEFKMQLNSIDEYLKTTKRFRKKDILALSQRICFRLNPLEYSLTNIELLIFHTGKALGYYNISHIEHKDESWDYIIKCLNYLSDEPQDIEYVNNMIVDFKKDDSVDVVNIPNRLYHFIKRLIRLKYT